MTEKQLDPNIRRMAELLYTENVGRLYACEHLENGIEDIEDSKILYGWNLLTQEVLIRLAETSLKLLYLLHFNKPSKKGHSLVDLWKELPESVQDEVAGKRLRYSNSERDISFVEYDKDDFSDVRYLYEDHPDSGRTIQREPRRLYLDSLAVNDLAGEWLGEIAVWPWAGMVSTALAGYRIVPRGDGNFEIVIDDPIEPMDWAGAIIEAKGEQYVWTLYCGFTDKTGKMQGFKIPALLYQWPIADLFADSVSECAEKVYRAYQEPCYPLLEAIRMAQNAKQ